MLMVLSIKLLYRIWLLENFSSHHKNVYVVFSCSPELLRSFDSDLMQHNSSEWLSNIYILVAYEFELIADIKFLSSI